MLKVVSDFEPGLIDQLFEIYIESVEKIFQNKMDFEEFCYDSFKDRSCIIFLWNVDGKNVSCVFSQIQDDGVLLYSLETMPQYRGRGCAQALIHSVIEYLKDFNANLIYTHIAKDNFTSLKIHRKLDFKIVKDTATLLDGTVSQRYYTLSYK